MDDIVKAALAKWPNVPACHGWLALDARGDWYMRDDRVQAAGPFPQVKGSRIEHDKLRGFIERNYDRDEAGCWYFQNGPQRVYVELEAAPWVWRLQAVAGGGGVRLVSHTGRAATFGSALTDEHGRVFIATDLGLGLVHTLDIETAADAIERGDWRLHDVPAAHLERRFGFRHSPAAEHRRAQRPPAAAATRDQAP